MPFYTYMKDKTEIELFLLMNEATPEKEINGKTYKLKFEASGVFVLKGNGWPTKGTGLLSNPKLTKEVGIKVDYDKKAEMKANGEKV